MPLEPGPAATGASSSSGRYPRYRSPINRERDRGDEHDHHQDELEDPVHPERARTRSAIRPPTMLPTAMPPKKPVRIADTAWVVLPKTRTSCRDQTISSIRAAAAGQDEDREDHGVPFCLAAPISPSFLLSTASVASRIPPDPASRAERPQRGRASRVQGKARNGERRRRRPGATRHAEDQPLRAIDRQRNGPANARTTIRDRAAKRFATVSARPEIASSQSRHRSGARTTLTIVMTPPACAAHQGDPRHRPRSARYTIPSPGAALTAAPPRTSHGHRRDRQNDARAARTGARSATRTATATGAKREERQHRDDVPPREPPGRDRKRSMRKIHDVEGGAGREREPAPSPGRRWRVVIRVRLDRDRHPGRRGARRPAAAAPRASRRCIVRPAAPTRLTAMTSSRLAPMAARTSTTGDPSAAGSQVVRPVRRRTP